MRIDNTLENELYDSGITLAHDSVFPKIAAICEKDSSPNTRS